MAGFLNRLWDKLKKPGWAFRLPWFLGAEAWSRVWNKIMWNNQTATPTTPTVQTTQRKQVQTYNPRYPWFDEEDYLRLEQLVDQQWVTWSKKAQLMDEAYQYYYPQVLNKHKLDERQEMINQWTYDNWEKLANGDKVTNAKYRLLSLTQMAKEKFDIAYNVEDAQIVDSIKEKVPNWEKLLTDFLNTGNPEILYASWIYDRWQQAQDFRSQKDIANSVLWWSFWKNAWNNMYANSFAPLDSAEKFTYRFIKNAQMLGTKIDDYFADKNLPEWLRKDAFWDKTAEQIRAENQQFRDTARREIDDYIWLVNDANQRNRTSTVNPIVDNYYQRRNFTDLLAEWDIDWFFYKWLWDAASNRDMPVIIWASIVNPAMWTALMWTNSYVRESEEAYETMRKAWATHEQAEVWAWVVWLINTAIEVYLDKRLWGTETTASTWIRDAIKKNVMKEVTSKPFEEIVSSATKTYARSSLEEWLEEWLQNIVTNAAEMTVKENPEWKDLFEWGRAAAEWWIFNPFNILAPWGDIARNTDVNTMQQSMIDWAYNLWVDARNVTDSLNNWAYNLWETTRNVTDRLGITNDWATNTQWNVSVEWAEMVTPQWTETTVDNTVTDINNNWDKATFKEEFYSIDPTLKKNLQNNPYSAEVWQRTQDYIDKNWRPERSNDVAKALIVDVADKVQEKLVEKMEEWGKNWKLYQTIDNAWFTVDLTELKDWLDEMLEWYGIEIEDGKLNFDKTAIDGSEASNIRKIYNWLQDTNAPMSEKEFRTRFKQAMKDMVDFNPNNKDQAWRRRADTPWDKVIKWIMKKANDLAHAQIPELAELDEIYSEWIDIMDEVSDWLVYKDAAKRWVIKDNVYQIIKNLDEPSRRQMVNRLEKLIPWIKDEVNAINQMPKVIDHIYNPSKLQQWLTSEWLKTLGSAGWMPWYLLAKRAWEGLSKIIDTHKNKAWNEVLQETSEEWKAKMAEIQAKIEENKRLTKEQEARLQWLKDRLLEKMATVEKTDAEQSAWNNWLADLEQDEVIDMPEEVYDQWEEITTTPKEKATKKKTSKKGLDKNQVSSKTAIVDKNWNPKNVYHYSDTDFDSFDMSKQKNKLGIYFSPSSKPNSTLRKFKITATIDMKNPLTISPENKASMIYPELREYLADEYEDQYDTKFRELLIRDWYDGVIMLDDKGNVSQYVVLNPEQVNVKKQWPIKKS